MLLQILGWIGDSNEDNKGSNEIYYINSKIWFWIISSYAFYLEKNLDGKYHVRLIDISSKGDIRSHWSDYAAGGVRPVVSLASGTIFAAGGDGTASNPYQVVAV